jgi:hypothetical protein
MKKIKCLYIWMVIKSLFNKISCKKINSKNKLLTNLMKSNMNLAELKDYEINLQSEKITLNAQIGFIDSFKKKEKNSEKYNNIIDRIKIIDELLIGIKAKKAEIAFLYEISINKEIKYMNNENFIWEKKYYVYTEKNVETPIEDEGFVIELLKEIEIETPYTINKIRKIKK